MTRHEKGIIQSIVNYHHRRYVIYSKAGDTKNASKEFKRYELLKRMMKDLSGSCTNCRYDGSENECRNCTRLKGRTDNFRIDKRFQLCHRVSAKREGYKIGDLV